MKLISGFSKLNRGQRIDFLTGHTKLDDRESLCLHDYDAPDDTGQQVFEDMIENYLGNFPLPMGVVTNLVLNGESLVIPLVTEESSVVAAAAKAAKFWAARGGFRAIVKSVTKKGQVHFTWNGGKGKIEKLFPGIRIKLLAACEELTVRMRERGGGIAAIELIDKTGEMADYYQLDLSFDTAEAMGANFINSCLECCASVLQHLPELNSGEEHIGIIMSILSNYTPDCLVTCWVECPVVDLGDWDSSYTGEIFAGRFRQAVDIANLDISRAVTHNKGIFNGTEALMVATGNDSRAVSAAAHAYAARDGQYRGLTTLDLQDQVFRYELELPLSIGTVGGVTRIHPVVKRAMAIMNHPDARKLMMIAAAAGLASNFAAVSSLITTGIQKGHMSMHLTNILNQLNVSKEEREDALKQFNESRVSFSAVQDYIRLKRLGK